MIIKCKVTDVDDEWIKLNFTDKRNKVVTKILIIENIDEVEIIEETRISEV